MFWGTKIWNDLRWKESRGPNSEPISIVAVELDVLVAFDELTIVEWLVAVRGHVEDHEELLDGNRLDVLAQSFDDLILLGIRLENGGDLLGNVEVGHLGRGREGVGARRAVP